MFVKILHINHSFPLSQINCYKLFPLSAKFEQSSYKKNVYLFMKFTRAVATVNGSLYIVF